MLITLVPSPFGRKKHYLNTLVFISKNPYDFGTYSKNKTNTSRFICSIEAHASEVIIFNGKYYLTTCGWKGFPKPEGVKEGVWIKEMELKRP